MSERQPPLGGHGRGGDGGGGCGGCGGAPRIHVYQALLLTVWLTPTGLNMARSKSWKVGSSEKLTHAVVLASHSARARDNAHVALPLQLSVAWNVSVHVGGAMGTAVEVQT